MRVAGLRTPRPGPRARRGGPAEDWPRTAVPVRGPARPVPGPPVRCRWGCSSLTLPEVVDGVAVPGDAEAGSVRRERPPVLGAQAVVRDRGELRNVLHVTAVGHR